jgi:hypothetical protein
LVKKFKTFVRDSYISLKIHAITYSKIRRYTLVDLKIKTTNNDTIVFETKKIRELKNEI